MESILCILSRSPERDLFTDQASFQEFLRLKRWGDGECADSAAIAMIRYAIHLDSGSLGEEVGNANKKVVSRTVLRHGHNGVS